MIDAIAPGLTYSVLSASVMIAVVAWYLRNQVRRVERSASEMAQRFGFASEKILKEQKSFREFVHKLPCPVMVLDRKDGLVIKGSELLSKTLLKNYGYECSETTFSYIFQNPSRYPDFLPKLRNILASDEPFLEPFNDVLCLYEEEGRNLKKLEVRLQVIICENTVIVTFDFSDNENLFAKQAQIDNKTIRSILNESDMISALNHASALLHCQLSGDLALGVSILNRESKTLKLTWQEGMDSSVEQFVQSLPLIFGDTPQATAVLLEKEVTINFVNKKFPIPSQGKIPERLHVWQSYPIKSANETVLGTFDLLMFEEHAEIPSDECIANFLFVVSILLERNRALSTIVRQAKNDQIVKEVSEMLLISNKSSEGNALHNCFVFLKTASELSEGSLGLVYENGNGEIRVFGELFCGKDLLDEKDGKSILRYLKDSQPDFCCAPGKASLELSFFEVGSVKALSLLNDLPVQKTMHDASFLVCPIVFEENVSGVLVFGVHSEPTEVQFKLLSMVSPNLINFLIRERLFENLQQRANHDQLTGLFNRGYIESELKSEVDRSRRYKNDLSVVLFDIDYFKSINDTFGHDVGDAVLKQVANRVQASLRSVDMIGRWGGEEFMVILAETHENNAVCVAENIRRLIESDIYSMSKPITISAGVAQFKGGDNLSDLIKRADIALYKAKDGGRNQVKASV